MFVGYDVWKAFLFLSTSRSSEAEVPVHWTPKQKCETVVWVAANLWATDTAGRVSVQPTQGWSSCKLWQLHPLRAQLAPSCVWFHRRAGSCWCESFPPPNSALGQRNFRHGKQEVRHLPVLSLRRVETTAQNIRDCVSDARQVLNHIW